MSRLNKVIQQNQNQTIKKKKPKKNTSIPVYDLEGKTITPEKKKKENRLAIILIIATCILSFLYLPGLFMKDETVTQTQQAEISLDSTAIRKSNNALRNNAEEDFDGDGLLNSEETTLGTDPWLIDTDGDGLTDYCEAKITKTDPKSSNSNLVDEQTKLDKNNEKKVGSPYKIGNVILWADDYESKSYGSVVETANGSYHFCYFNGYAQFPETKGKYAYRVKDGVRTPLPYREAENAWKITADDMVELHEQPLEEVVELSFFGKKAYIPSNPFTNGVAKVLPNKGFITGTIKMKMDIEPNTEDGVVSEIKKPSFDSSDEYRFTMNSNTLNDLLFVRDSVAEDNCCIAVSLFNKEAGEYLGIVYGYTSDGNLLIADMNTLQPVGELKIKECARKMLNDTGEIVSVSYFDFEGFGFNSKNGDRISFFAASSKNNAMENYFEKDMKKEETTKESTEETTPEAEEKTTEETTKESTPEQTPEATLEATPEAPSEPTT